MIDHIFSAALTFCLLVAGTLAIGSALFDTGHVASAHTRIVQLERVVVVGKRLAPAASVAKADEPGTQRVQ